MLLKNGWNIPDDFCAWFTGLIDGEGHFHAGFQKGSKNLRLTIELREDDAQILRKLKKVLGGVGRLYSRKSRGPSKGTIIWTVNDFDSIRGVILPVIEKYGLQTKKAKEFQIFKMLIHTKTLYARKNLSRETKSILNELFIEGVQMIKDVRKFK